MSRKTEIMTAVGTLACAIGIGFVMQSGEGAELRYGSGKVQHSTVTPTPTNNGQINNIIPTSVPSATMEIPVLEPREDAQLALSEITLTSADVQKIAPPPIPPAPAVPISAPEENIDEIPVVSDMSLASACAAMATAEPRAAAMVKLILTAPCAISQQVTIDHEGVAFSGMTKADGTLEISVPALAEQAAYTINLPDGESVEVVANVASFSLYGRIVLQSAMDTGVEIHVREFGADYGDSGHVWVGAPNDLTALSGNTGGYLTRYGTASAEGSGLAEVYTFPATMRRKTGAINLSVEAEVTAQNCGKDVSAMAIEVDGGTPLRVTDLLLSVPDCDAIGNYLVLNNLLQDLKVASN
jgi:hypothetical protein